MNTSLYTVTEHKIGKTTCFVVSAPSEKAAEALDKKVEKLIKKDIQEASCYSWTK